MPEVARVIYNRLAQGMPLQMDSTVLYAIGQDGGPVTSKDLQIQSPYNTYLNTGLPPTPDLHAVAGRAGGRGAPAGGRVAVLRPRPEERRHGVLRHLRASSWPTSSWPSRVGSPEPRWPHPEGRRRPDHGRGAPSRRPRRRHRGGHRQPDRALALAAAAQHRLRGAGPRCGWHSFAFEVAAGEAGRGAGGHAAIDVAGLSVTMPHKAAVAALVDGVQRGGPPARRGELRRATATASLYGHEHRRRRVRGLAGPGRGLRPGRTPLPRRRRRRRGAGGGPRPGRAGAAEVAVVNRTPARAAAAAGLAGPAGPGRDAGATSRGRRRSPRPTSSSTPRRWAWPGRRRGGRVGAAPAPPAARARWRRTWSTRPARRPGWSKRPTPGPRALDGLGMLVHQAAAQLALWTGAEPPVEAMWAAAEAASPAGG